jgi:excisionase family DNA binding protein
LQVSCPSATLAQFSNTGAALARDPQAEDTLGDYLKVRAAAEYKGVSRGTIYKAIREGRLKPFRPNPPYLISRVTLDAWETQPHKGSRAMNRPKGR